MVDNKIKKIIVNGNQVFKNPAKFTYFPAKNIQKARMNIFHEVKPL